jgi:GGDEF domain-containing protein
MTICVINCFKIIYFGDLALIQLAELMKSKVEQQHVFARWGGEEFIILVWPYVSLTVLKLSISNKIIAIFSSLRITFSHSTSSIEKIAIILFDIDNFKTVNDTYGHDFGDLALIQLAVITYYLFPFYL